MRDIVSVRAKVVRQAARTLVATRREVVALVGLLAVTDEDDALWQILVWFSRRSCIIKDIRSGY